MGRALPGPWQGESHLRDLPVKRKRVAPPAFRGERCRMTTIPNTMIAIDPTGPGGPEVLQPVERPVPEPGPGEVLIRVEAAGVNRPDVMQRLGFYPPPPGAPSIPGL